MMEPCHTPYLMVWDSDLSLLRLYTKFYCWDSFLRTNQKLQTNQSCNNLVWKEGIMIDSVKGFLQVYEDTTGKFAIVKSISYHFCEAYKSMISWIIISKTKVIRKQYLIFLRKLVNQIRIAFSLILLILDGYLYWIERWVLKY